MKSYIFGPVISRRLGLSLGIDLVPYKTCSMNCIYCECGKTTNLTIERKEYYPTNEIIRQIDQYMKENKAPDYITFSGAGEPTLHIGIKDIIKHIKSHYPNQKLALLTNSSFMDMEIAKDFMSVDMVMPSLDCATDDCFKKLNRPHPNLNIQKIIDNLIQFSRQYRGELFLEVFIVKGINDTKEEIEALKEAIYKIKPTKLGINSLDRPPAEDFVKPIARNRLIEIANEINYPNTIIIARDKDKNLHTQNKQSSPDIDKIKNLLMRRPCTIEEIASITNIKTDTLKPIILTMIKSGDLISENINGTLFYKLNIN